MPKTVRFYEDMKYPRLGKDRIHNRRIWNQVVIDVIEYNLACRCWRVATGCWMAGIVGCDLPIASGRDITIPCNRCELQDFFIKNNIT